MNVLILDDNQINKLEFILNKLFGDYFYFDKSKICKELDNNLNVVNADKLIKYFDTLNSDQKNKVKNRFNNVDLNNWIKNRMKNVNDINKEKGEIIQL